MAPPPPPAHTGAATTTSPRIVLPLADIDHYYTVVEGGAAESRVKFVSARHSSSLPGGSGGTGRTIVSRRVASAKSAPASKAVINFYASKTEAASLRNIHLDDSAGGSKYFLVNKPDGSSSVMKIGEARVKKLVSRPRSRRLSG